jgi:N-acetyl-anhydromuramyl-L-alanine amidase AmpD
VVRQFVLHHDGCDSANTCFKVLHNERGLSCHFLLDNDGTIYQTLDLAFMAFHAAGFNAESIGIELSNRGDAKAWPNYYKRQRRETTTVRIHGHVYQCYQFTPEQNDAMRALAKGLSRALPNLPLEYPQDDPGHQAWSEIPNAKRFAGYMGHYHTTRRKWDPGPFDFKAFCEKGRGSLCFPIFAKKPVPGERPEIPEQTDALTEKAEELYRLNEGESEGGYFPVGPTSGEGESRLWHGGVHLPGPFKAPVFAPFPGRLMVARMGSNTDVGSVNFVLLRHDMTIGKGSIRFYSLYFHLHNELDTDPKEPGAPEWLATPEWQQKKGNRRIVLLSEPIEAGRIIGRVGKGGPHTARTSQIHFEIFAGEEVTEKIETDKSLLSERWVVVDGTVGGRFSRSSKINDLMDTSPRDGKISRAELLSFFRTNSDRNLIRNFAILHPTEWIDTPSWFESLKVAPEFAALGDDTLRRLVEEQITPTLWWTDEVAKHAKLHKDGVVFHYHPLSFVKYINSKLLQAKALAKDGIGDFDASLAKVTPEGVTDDIGDESGDSFVEVAELDSEAFDDSLSLEELVKGFPE